MRMPTTMGLLLVTLCLAGCAKSRPTAEQIAAGGALPRPVVVIGGYTDFGFGGRPTAGELRQLTGDGRILAVHPGFRRSFDRAADLLIDEIDAAFGPGPDGETVEVDVVAISMGGLVARWAAAPGGRFGEGDRRLKVRRLYTICAPHTGAQLADRWGWADLFLAGRHMRTGSDFLRDLTWRELRAGAAETYPIVQYARENDVTIGPGSALPEHLWGRGQVIWIGMPFWQSGHTLSWTDERILNDIVRRLMSAG